MQIIPETRTNTEAKKYLIKLLLRSVSYITKCNCNNIINDNVKYFLDHIPELKVKSVQSGYSLDLSCDMCSSEGPALVDHD